jgi:hypothetical protein
MCEKALKKPGMDTCERTQERKGWGRVKAGAGLGCLRKR